MLVTKNTARMDKPLINVVTKSKPKVLTGLDQNGTRLGMPPRSWGIVDNTPPANRRGPHRSEIDAEQGKPVVLPETAGKAQAMLLALRVKDCGASERLSVMDRIA